MTTISFPRSPALNAEYSVGDKTWIWNGTGWVAKAPAGFTLAGLSDGTHLYMAIRKSI